MDIIDKESTCRTCINNDAVFNIFTSHITSQTNQEYCHQVMTALFSVPAIREDGLPFKICKKCYHELSSAYRFKQLVEKSYRQLLLLTNGDNVKLESMTVNTETVKDGESSGLEDVDDINVSELDENSKMLECDANISDLLRIKSENRIIKCEAMKDGKSLNLDNDCDMYNGQLEMNKMWMHTIDKPAYTKRRVRDTNISDLLPFHGSDHNTHFISERDFDVPVILKCQVDSSIKIESENSHARVKKKKRIKFKAKHRSKKIHRNVGTKQISTLPAYSLIDNSKTNRKPRKKLSIVCDLCQKVFASKPAMIRHLMIHNGERPFLCPECGIRFRQVNHLKRHMDFHNRVKSCSLTNSGSHSVRCHMKKTVKLENERPKTFACHYCPKMFRLKSDVIIHERIHTGEKPYVCEYCSKGFTQSNALRCHKRTHTGERPYSCDICFKRFTEKSSVNTHMKVHTGGDIFACEICTTAFTSKFNLNRHKKTHAECKKKFEKLAAGKEDGTIVLGFSCKVCDKSFSEGSDLENHVRNHKRKYFSCDECNIQFSQKNKLIFHMMSHESQKILNV